MEKSEDDVSNIHNRFSLTLVNPSSQYFSLVVSLLVASAITAITHLMYLETDELWFRIPAVVATLGVVQLIDIQFTKRKEYSKSLHASLFGNLLWLLTLVMGIAAGIVLSKELSLFFITFGMLLFASFRIGIFTTTLGVSIKKAWAICLVQPLAMFVVLIPTDMWIPMVTDPMTLGYGISFIIIATAWVKLTDRAGRPGMESTHRTIQAYLASQKNDFSEAEELMELRSSKTTVATTQIRLHSPNHKTDFRMVLPEIHPGPYHPVGGSNIPYLIYKNLDSSAMVMHSISDHSLNLPSRNEVENYLKNLENSITKEEGLTCTEPVTVQINKARVLGILFGNNPILFLSLSPYGMEDIPNYMKKDIEQYAKNRNYSKPFIVDSHNAMGKEISKEDAENMLKAAKSCLDTLIRKNNYPIEFGYANSDDMDVWTEDLGMGGLGIMCLKINDKKFFLGWADANNMENGVREKIVQNFADKNYNLLEICTSDTHFARVKARNKNGYYQLGLMTTADKLSNWLLEIAKKAEEGIGMAKYEILENQTEVKIMGQEIFQDFSKALDNSLRITKMIMIGCAVLFLTSLFL
jgi:putative membrane protein